MGIGRRISTIFRAKASKALDRAEDPRETLDYSYERQQELLQKVRRGLTDVATSRKRVELQAQQLRAAGEKLEDQAKQALEQNREDLAREAIERRTGILSQLTELKVQHEQLKAEEQKLTDASRRLQAKVQAFKIKKETIKATYTAAEAQTRINEAVTGISEEMGDVGMAMQRAQDRTEQMRARAGALDEMISSGALEDLSAPADPIQAQLDSFNQTSGVELELDRLKKEIGYEQAPAIEAKTGREGSK
jgi:phage shock protein A